MQTADSTRQVKALFFFRIRQGQSLAEFAIVLPIFLLLLYGLINGALALSAYNGITFAVAQGVSMAEQLDANGSLSVVDRSKIDSTIRLALPSIVHKSDVALVVKADPLAHSVTISAVYDYPVVAGGILGRHTYNETVTIAGPAITNPTLPALTPGPYNPVTNLAVISHTCHVPANGTYDTVQLTWTSPVPSTTGAAYVHLSMWGNSGAASATLLPAVQPPYTLNVGLPLAGAAGPLSFFATAVYRDAAHPSIESIPSNVVAPLPARCT